MAVRCPELLVICWEKSFRVLWLDGCRIFVPSCYSALPPQASFAERIGPAPGRYAADVLHRLNRPSVVIELDQHAVEQARDAGLRVIYGDAGSPVVLEAAGIHHARLLLVSVPAAVDVELIVARARELNPELHIVARAARLTQLETLRALGVYELVQPEFEAGLEMVRQALMHFNVPALEIQRFTDAVRRECYQPLY